MNKDKLLKKTGIIGSIVMMIFCFMPVLLFGALGRGALCVGAEFQFAAAF